jgi:opacity protein-like surface antigen
MRRIARFSSSSGICFLFLTLVTIAFVPRAMAQSQGPIVEPLISNTAGLGVQLGYTACPDAELGGAPYINLVSRFRFGAVLGLEAGVGYKGKQRFSFDAPTGEDYSAKVHSLPFTGSLILFIPLTPSFVPYLVGGVGAHYVVLDYSADLNETIGDKSKTRFGYHAGAGVEIALNNHVGLVGDYRYQFVDNAFEKELEVDFSNTEYRSSQLAAGIVVYF